MGNKISIQFQTGEDVSVALFSHWDGTSLLEKVKAYGKEYSEEKTNEGVFYPLDRLEPNTVMIDFLRWLTKDMPRVKSNYYLGVDEFHGDNSDNGHFIIYTETLKHNK